MEFVCQRPSLFLCANSRFRDHASNDFHEKIKLGDRHDRRCEQTRRHLHHDVRLLHRVLDCLEDKQERAADHHDGVEECDEDWSQATHWSRGKGQGR